MTITKYNYADLIALNIPSFMGGIDIWGDEKTKVGVKKDNGS